MATKKSSKESPKIKYGTANPNTGKVVAAKIGDLYINTDLKTLYFCVDPTASSPWGTAGTA